MQTSRAHLKDAVLIYKGAIALLESSTPSEWVARHFESMGMDVIVADPNFSPMALCKWAEGIAQRRGKRIATVVLARWLSGIMWAMTRDGTEYSQRPVSSPVQRVTDSMQRLQARSVQSFVPQVKDFARLDARFRMPDGIWDKLPAYQKSGFAVFKLRKNASSVHPMAFSFPRAVENKLFFPTVHIHDGKVHDFAHFDHSLYCQVGSQYGKTAGWDETPQLASAFMKVAATKDIIDGRAHCYRKIIRGNQKNQDTWL